MTARFTIAGFLLASLFSAFGQVKKSAQPDLPKQQIEQSKAETDLKKAQTALAHAQTDLTKAETEKTKSEAISASVQANTDTKMTRPLVDSVGGPAVESLTSKVDITSDLMELLGTDGASAQLAEVQLKKLTAIVVPEQRYQVAMIRQTIQEFLASWGPVPASPRKELAVRDVNARLRGQISALNTIPGRKVAVGIGEATTSFETFITDSLRQEPIVPTRAMAVATNAHDILEQSAPARKWVKLWINAAPDPLHRRPTKQEKGAAFKMGCRGVSRNVAEYRNDPRTITVYGGVPWLDPASREVLSDFCNATTELREDEIVDAFELLNRTIAW